MDVVTCEERATYLVWTELRLQEQAQCCQHLPHGSQSEFNSGNELALCESLRSLLLLFILPLHLFNINIDTLEHPALSSLLIALPSPHQCSVSCRYRRISSQVSSLCLSSKLSFAVDTNLSRDEDLRLLRLLRRRTGIWCKSSSLDTYTITDLVP